MRLTSGNTVGRKLDTIRIMSTGKIRQQWSGSGGTDMFWVQRLT